MRIAILEHKADVLDKLGSGERGEYFVRQFSINGENCITKSFVICTLHQV
jgi:hypothetical protein